MIMIMMNRRGQSWGSTHARWCDGAAGWWGSIVGVPLWAHPHRLLTEPQPIQVIMHLGRTPSPPSYGSGERAMWPSLVRPVFD
jgi:hypothetical protein